MSDKQKRSLTMLRRLIVLHSLRLKGKGLASRARRQTCALYLPRGVLKLDRKPLLLPVFSASF
jgi:hypothetical protein